MAFKFQPLNIAEPIVDASGRPTAQFQIFWQSLGRQLEAQEGAQDDLISELQEAQETIGALQAQQAVQLDYLIALGDWNAAYSAYLQGQIGYIFCVLGKLVMETGTDITGCGEPDDGPPYPGPAPAPPDPPEDP